MVDEARSKLGKLSSPSIERASSPVYTPPPLVHTKRDRTGMWFPCNPDVDTLGSARRGTSRRYQPRDTTHRLFAFAAKRPSHASANSPNVRRPFAHGSPKRRCESKFDQDLFSSCFFPSLEAIFVSVARSLAAEISWSLQLAQIIASQIRKYNHPFESFGILFKLFSHFKFSQRA